MTKNKVNIADALDDLIDKGEHDDKYRLSKGNKVNSPLKKSI